MWCCLYQTGQDSLSGKFKRPGGRGRGGAVAACRRLCHKSESRAWVRGWDAEKVRVGQVGRGGGTRRAFASGTRGTTRAKLRLFLCKRVSSRVQQRSGLVGWT